MPGIQCVFNKYFLSEWIESRRKVCPCVRVYVCVCICVKACSVTVIGVNCCLIAKQFFEMHIES